MIHDEIQLLDYNKESEWMNKDQISIINDEIQVKSKMKKKRLNFLMNNKFNIKCKNWRFENRNQSQNRKYTIWLRSR